MSTPTDSVAPVAPTGTSSPWSMPAWWKRIADWIAALSPSGADKYDTGWVTVTPTGSFSHGSAPGRVRRIGKEIFFQGGVSGSIAQNVTTIIGNIPAEFRPPDGTRTIASGAATQGTAVYYMNVEPNGDIRVRVTPTGTYNVALGGLGYLLD